MRNAQFDEDSVIQKNTDLDSFVPPYPGWNYVRVLNNPEDKDPYLYIKECPNTINVGKWLLFTPNKDFVKVFRKAAKLAKDFKLTHCFKASGRPSENGEHVFCIYCGDYKNISFVRQIGNTLIDEGLLMEYGYKYRDGTKALFFKTDATTHYKSEARGESLTLFKIDNNRHLYIKEFNIGRPSWKLVEKDNDSSIVENFESHLMDLEMENIE